MRKKVLIVAMALGFTVMSTGVAQAQAWDLIHEKQGNGRVTLRAWTRNYNQVAFVADHAGTRIDVSVVVNCRNGDRYDNTWSDGGRRFRFVLGGLGNSGRCNHTFRVVAADSFPDLDLTLWARG